MAKRHSTPSQASNQEPNEGDLGLPEFSSLSNAQRLNPSYLGGQDLKNLGYNMGLSRSLMETMSDEKIRRETIMIAYRNVSNQEAVIAA